MVKMKFSAIVEALDSTAVKVPARCAKAARRTATRETGCRQVYTRVVSPDQSDLDRPRRASRHAQESRQAGTGAE